jgi:HNH endonuclease
MRPLIEDVLDVLQEILTAYSAIGSGRSLPTIRQQAVQTVAARELAGHRFKNRDSAEKSIHDACARRLNLRVSKFDALVSDWLSGHPEDLQSLLATVDGYVQNRAAVESLLTARPAGYVRVGHSVVPGETAPAPRRPAEILASDVNDAAHPERRETVLQRLIRDTATARALKLLHQNQCQICGLAVPLWDGLTYAEAHHIRPLGQPHNGPDSPGNILILCPNHHAQCDLGAIRLDLALLRLLPDHVIDTNHTRYHNATIAK